MRRANSHRGVLLAVVVLSLFGNVPSADAFVFRRIFGGGGFFRGGPVFNRGGFSQGPRQQSCCRPQPGVTSSRSRNNNQVVEIKGFSRIVNVGGQIFERNSFGQLRPIFILNDGTVRGATETDTVSQLVQFYVENRKKFNGNNLRKVNNFLAAYGGFSNGQFVLNMNVGMDKADGDLFLPGDEDKLQLAALNYFLNDVIQSNQLVRIQGAGKEVPLNLQGLFNQDALNVFAQSDPTAACTGGRIRLNALIKYSLATDNYYQLIEARNKDQFAADYGIAPRKEQSVQNKVLVMKKDRSATESGVVSGDQRVLEFQPINRYQVRTGPGSAGLGTCYGSYDGEVDGDHRKNLQRDVTLQGVNFAHDAEEWLCMSPNGFSFRRYLFNGAGQLQNNAPANVVTKNINAGHSCLECHAQGFLGGGERLRGGLTNDDGSPKESYTENFDLFRGGHHEQFFTNNPTYRAQADRDTQILFANQREAGALIEYTPGGKPKDGKPGKTYKKPFALIDSIIKKFDGPLTEVEAARELGLPDNAFKGRFVGQGFIDTGAAGSGGKVARAVFESKACLWRAEATGQLPSSRPAGSIPSTTHSK